MLPTRTFLLPILFLTVFAHQAWSQLTVAQISDIHIGVSQAPDAAEKLQRAVDSVNALHPDLVVVTGDIGENPQAWEQAKSILAKLKAPLKYMPGNHDVHSTDVAKYRKAFGDDYYTFDMKGVTFVVIDSQLLGNFDQFGATSAPALPEATAQEADKMLQWLNSLAPQQSPPPGTQGPAALAPKSLPQKSPPQESPGKKKKEKPSKSRPPKAFAPGPNKIVIGLQHVPGYRNGDFPKDPKPYWVINEPYLSREMDALKKLGVQHMLVGHWHRAQIFLANGITWHVAPATSWLPWGGTLGFALHRISTDGSVSTEFFDLGANNLGKSTGDLRAVPSTACQPPSSRAVHICQPSGGPDFTSPLQVSAAAAGTGTMKVTQLYVDGQKLLELPGNSLEVSVPLAAGQHQITVQGLDDTGFFKSTMQVTVH